MPQILDNGSQDEHERDTVEPLLLDTLGTRGVYPITLVIQ